MEKKKGIALHQHQRRIVILITFILMLGSVLVVFVSNPAIFMGGTTTNLDYTFFCHVRDRILYTDGKQSIILDVNAGDWNDITLSPEGDYLSYTIYNDGYASNYAPVKLFTYHIESEQTYQIGSGSDGLRYSWSPDGHWLAYSSDIDETWDIFISDVTSTQQIQITDDNNRDSMYDWSPDGRKLLHLRPSGSGQLAISTLDENFAEINTSVIANHPYWFASARWSPDGNWIAYHSGGATSPHYLGVFPINDPSQDESILANHGAVIGYQWSPDSQAILYEYSAGVYVHRLGVTEDVALQADHFVDWLPNNQVLVEDDLVYWFIDYVTQEHRLVNLPICAQYIGWREG